MRKLHPLRLRSVGETRYKFLFRTADGDQEFNFFVDDGGTTITDVDMQFHLLAQDDLAVRCINCCVFWFNDARVSGGTRLGSSSERGQPISIEYKGECRDGAYKYLVALKDTDASVHTEEVVVSYKDPANVLLWSGGQCSFGFDRMAMLEVKEPKPEFGDLLNAILQFDQSRYLPSYDNEEPMKIELP